MKLLKWIICFLFYPFLFGCNAEHRSSSSNCCGVYGDLNNDEKPDLVYSKITKKDLFTFGADRHNSYGLFVSLRQKDNGFENPFQIATISPVPFSIRIVDINGDKNNDILFIKLKKKEFCFWSTKKPYLC